MSSKSFVWALPFVLAVCLVVVPLASADQSLQEVYNAAGPGEGYDKLLDLDPQETYIGDLLICDWNSVCIHGNGALVVTEDPRGYAISVLWSRLDVDHLVIECGLGGIEYDDDSYGVVENNTIVGASESGIRTRLIAPFQPMRLINNIIAYNYYGVFVEEYSEPSYVAYNDLWDNPHGHYVKFCEG